MTTTTRGRYAAPATQTRWAAPTILVGLLVIVVAIVSACGADLSGQSGSGSVPIETAEPEIVVETVAETVEVTPQICKDALDAAEATITAYEELIELKSELIELTAWMALETVFDDESSSEFDAQLDDFNVRQDALIAEKDESLMAFVTAGLECDPDWANR